jgi:LPXTG-motif cell wall-anchored protein
MEELLEPETPDENDETSDSILPFSGIPSLAIAISVAILFRRRRE